MNERNRPNPVWFNYLALAGYFGLLTTLLLWFTWLAPPKKFPRAFLLILLVVPLLLPLRGLLHQKRYTHQWTSLFSLLYFAIGIDTAWNGISSRPLALTATAFSLMLFVGCVLYARYSRPSA